MPVPHRRGSPCFRTHVRAVDGVRWSVRESVCVVPDHARRVVLVPGLGSGSYLLRHGALLAPHLHVAIPDMPGFGRTRSRERLRSIDDFADALAGWLRAADFAAGGPVGVVGSSLGTQIAAATADRHPDLVDRLVLVGPTFDESARSVRGQLRRWVRTSAVEPPSLAASLAVSYAQCGVRTPVAAFTAGLHDALEQRLARLDLPVLLVRGTRDRIAPAAWVQALTRRTGRGRYAVVPAAAHTVDYSHPRELADLTIPFLTVNNQTR